MGYNGTFNFDIKEQNLSLIGENYQFQYNGTCEIPIKDYYNNTPDPEPLSSPNYVPVRSDSSSLPSCHTRCQWQSNHSCGKDF